MTPKETGASQIRLEDLLFRARITMATAQKPVNQTISSQQDKPHEDGQDLQAGRQHQHHQQLLLLQVDQLLLNEDALRQLTEEHVEIGRSQFICRLKNQLEIG